MKINSLLFREPEQSSEACQELVLIKSELTGQTEIRRVAVGTDELSHACGGSFAYTETRMSSAELQSIKNAVNTYKVSFSIQTPNRNAETEPH